jgi:hypothetical protein
MASGSSAKASGSGGNDRDVAIEAGNFLKELEVRLGSHSIAPPLPWAAGIVC